MKLGLISFTCAVTALAAGASSATTVTIDFDFEPDKVFEEVFQHEEDGFTGVVTIIGSPDGDDGLFLNEDYAAKNFDDGQTIDWTRDNGGSFSLVSLDWRGFEEGLPSDEFTLLGFRDGSEVANYGSFTTTSGAFQTFLSPNAIVIDALRFLGSDINQQPVVWDNLVLDTHPIPLPAALPLLLAALGGLGFVARKRTA